MIISNLNLRVSAGKAAPNPGIASSLGPNKIHNLDENFKVKINLKFNNVKFANKNLDSFFCDILIKDGVANLQNLSFNVRPGFSSGESVKKALKFQTKFKNVKYLKIYEQKMP